jgi:hypothetical protein
VLQFKPGLLADRELCDDILDRMETAVGKARTAALGDRPKARRPRGDKAKKLRKAA